MNMNATSKPRLLVCRASLALGLALLQLPLASGLRADEPARVAPSYAAGYDRLLPLEGGSNFRDMGGYFSTNGMQVRRGLLFRSGVMSSLTESDKAYLQSFGFQRVIDLRSSDERELYPNYWAASANIEVLARDYSMLDLVKDMTDESGQPRGMDALYRGMANSLRPQLQMLFDEALAGHVPLVVNCSAGQDRTGLSSALLLLALGVPRDVVMQDYLMSTRYRRPDVEKGDVDLVEAAKSNAFARMMLAYGAGEGTTAKPLLTEEGVPYLHYALAQLEADYGSVEAFLERELAVDADDLAALRQRYLVATYLAD
jgi:protein-tyrosine phosphatase